MHSVALLEHRYALGHVALLGGPPLRANKGHIGKLCMCLSLTLLCLLCSRSSSRERVRNNRDPFRSGSAAPAGSRRPVGQSPAPGKLLSC
ncbi:hypothetical protein NDU88_005242 [Pleurodeles waltl]|uniref:Secreted protein n=1 Tax=Pleurodeles waltl TaxID=8319 RepID=A0AAV7TV22_PLEWA|nr:hypothetical protein NDU88_005242 [Pleurodeles waltl]